MLVSGYFSHWDTQGYKPYMRYTLLGGKGSVSENVAYMWSTGTITDVKSALKKLEYGMMYDDASSNWGHRDNILDSFHNKVSIGIATNRTHVYLVQDFEDDYVNLSVTTSFGHVRINGTIHQSKPEISQIAIRFDNISDLTVQQLSNPPYDGSYASGAYVGMVVPPPEPGTEYIPPETGILVIATTWDQAGQNIDLTFDLSPAVSESGTGVYTLYLYTKANEHLTNYSLWYNG